MKITGESTITRTSGVVSADVQDTHVLLNEDLRYLGLDPIARRVWDLLEQPATLDDLVAALVTEYDVSPDQCRTDVTALVQAMAEHRLVTVG
ncbi:MAG: PqqD family protein [Nocardioides sp.]|nr:PqqD family protein [Nocardioides sp.]